MVTNKCVLTGSEEDLEAVLKEVELAAVYNRLARKPSIQLRLLAEEMIGVERGILGFVRGEFYMENDKNEYKLHLDAQLNLEPSERDAFVNVSSSKRNEVYKGFKGKILKAIDSMMGTGAASAGVTTPMASTYMENEVITGFQSNGLDLWQLTRYEEENRDNQEIWDELEKSIVACLADDILIGFREGQLRMTVIRKFKSES